MNDEGRDREDEEAGEEDAERRGYVRKGRKRSDEGGDAREKEKEGNTEGRGCVKSGKRRTEGCEKRGTPKGEGA